MKLILAFILSLVLSPFTTAGEIPRVEDGNKNYVTAFGDVPDNVIAAVRSDYPTAHYRKIAESDPIASRYTGYFEFPSIVVQDPSGKVLYKKSEFGAERNPHPLDAPIGGNYRPGRPCPAPVAPVAPTVEPPVLIEPVPDTPESSDDPDILAALLIAAAGAAGGAGRKIYSEMKG